MSKSKIENRLNTMRHKQAQPTDSLILAESAEGKDFSQELSKAQPFDEIPSLTEKQVAFGMCNPQAHLDAKQEKLERFKKKRAEKKLALAIDKSSFPNPTEDYDARSVAAPNNPSFEELLEIGMKLQNQPAPPSPEEPIVKKGPKTQSLVGMTRELQKKVSIISYHGALYFFNGRYYEYLDTDRLLICQTQSSMRRPFPALNRSQEVTQSMFNANTLVLWCLRGESSSSLPATILLASKARTMLCSNVSFISRSTHPFQMTSRTRILRKKSGRNEMPLSQRHCGMLRNWWS